MMEKEGETYRENMREKGRETKTARQNRERVRERK